MLLMLNNLLLFGGLFFCAQSDFLGYFLLNSELCFILFIILDSEEVQAVSRLFDVVDVEIEGCCILGVLFGSEFELEFDRVLLVMEGVHFCRFP